MRTQLRQFFNNRRRRRHRRPHQLELNLWPKRPTISEIFLRKSKVTQSALALLPSEAELQSLSWKCTACGHMKHFTRPLTAAVADRCPKCKGDSFRVH